MIFQIDDKNDMARSSTDDDSRQIGLARNYLWRLRGKVKVEPYVIDSGPGEGCFLLCKDGIFWSVSYLERGQRLSPALFLSVFDAITFFLLKVTGKVVTWDELTNLKT